MPARPKHRAAHRKSPVEEGRVLLLKRTPYGESSLIVHGLTAQGQRIELIAKGAHRPKSRFSGVLDWFDTLLLEWNPPRVPMREAHHRADAATRTSELGTLRKGDLHHRRRHITGSLESYRAAHSALEVAALATRSGNADAHIFSLLELALDDLNALGCAGLGGAPGGVPGEVPAEVPAEVPGGEAKEREDLPAWIHLTLARFELRLLHGLGLAPSLGNCAMCGGLAPPLGADGRSAGDRVAQSQGESDRAAASESPRAVFSASAGGRLCAVHAQEARQGKLRVGTLPASTLGAALHLSRGMPLDSVLAGRDHVDPRAFALRILDFTGRFLEYQLEARPKSQSAFLAAPDRNRRSRPQSP